MYFVPQNTFFVNGIKDSTHISLTITGFCEYSLLFKRKLKNSSWSTFSRFLSVGLIKYPIVGKETVKIEALHGIRIYGCAAINGEDKETGIFAEKSI